ncbi:TonB-dependent siderophore receptor [Siphonobacter aquaeclarae]|uniref:Iron complex outermembrane recepter protein n=1 Tax=Siphonobacter aquaeclarae TaxID=563176 RepID=A0A1G9W2L3_9BACT|nr:TonB-dependent siderophore receptor [Siphonobacter aquaeclarae]SDM78543.1 iron complex outermembrane recepter protein [Siphonobacter aquaeclarae]
MRFFTLLAALLVGSTSLMAQTGIVRGKITTVDGKAAEYVNINILGTRFGTLSDASGRFEIKNVKSGTYTLRVSLVGLETKEQSIQVQSGQVTNVPDIFLAENANQLQEVLVLAGAGKYNEGEVSPSLRLATPILELPQNVQLLSSKMLADQQVTSMSDGVIRNVSGATRLEHWGDMYTNVHARGDRVAAFRNGVNVTSPWGPLTEDMSFVERIEFVKGPAGFMMSNGDPSGIYNVVTKRPTGETRGEVGLMLGSFDFYRATLDLDGKINDRLLYRVNTMGQSKNSFRANEYNNRFSIAPVLTYKLSDKSTLTAEYIYQFARMSNVGSYYVFDTKGYATLPRDFTLMEPGLDPTTIHDHNLNLQFQHQLSDNWKLTAQLSYFDYKQQGSSMWPNAVNPDGSIIRSVSIWDASNVQKFGQVFVNGDIKTGVVRHRILGGLDLGSKEYMADWNQAHALDTTGSFNIHHPVYGMPANGFPSFDRSKGLRERAGLYGIVSQSYTGLYLQDELGFFDNRLRLTLAGRYTDARNNDYNTVTSAKRFTPRVGLSYSINDNTAVYALFDQTFVPQSGLRRDGKSIVPMTGDNLEAGIKRNWFGGKWMTSLTVYRIIKNNQTVPDPSNGAGESYVVQFGQTKTEGIEFDLRGEIVPGLTLVANYALTDSKITKSTTESEIGNKVPGYAKHNGNAWLNYKLQKGVLKGLGISAGINYQVDRTTWSWPGATGQMPLPDYTRIDGGAFWENGKTRLTLNVFNIANKYLYTGASYGAYYYWQAEAPRNLRLGLIQRF